MNRNCIRIAACALAGTIAFSGYQTIHAQTRMSRMLPAAGIAVVLEEGTTIQELTEEVIQNIAYLESASGLQPNIMNATEKVHNATLSETETVLSSTANLTSVFNNEVEQITKRASDEMMASVVSTASTEEKAETEETQSFGLLTSIVSVFTSDSQDTKDKITPEVQETTEESSSVEESSEVQDSVDTKDKYEKNQTEESTEVEADSEEETSEEASTQEVSSEGISEEEEETSEEEDFTGLVIAQVNKYVNVRSIPSETGDIVGKLYDKSVGDLVEEVDGWYKITSGNCTGYVKAEYCVAGEEAQELAKQVGTTYAIVNTTSLKVRKEAGTDSATLGLVPLGEELVVIEELDGWVKIAIEEGDGYVSRDYVDLRTEFVHAESKEEEAERLAAEKKAREEAIAAARAAEAEKARKEAQKAAEEQKKQQEVQQQVQTDATVEQTDAQADSQSEETVEIQEVQTPASSSIGQAVIDYATQFVGNPYVYGGTSLTNGTDCSGFVMGVYNNFGVSLPHSSSAMRSKGYDVGGLENAQPGDIVCYSGHVALYVGDGKIVHASTSKTGIIISNANYRSVLTVRRIF